MNFTFGIVTVKGNEKLLKKTIRSIEKLNIPNYEIYIIGGNEFKTKNSKVYQIPFDDSFYVGWLTKKKNIITKLANYENIVYSHDYISFDSGWYEGFLRFGNNFNIAMNKIVNKDGTRYRDWVLWPHNNNDEWNTYFTETRECLIPYETNNMSKHMYISGAFWVAKKNIMENYPLNENLIYLDPEDVEWSERVRRDHNFKMNIYSSVKLLRQKDVAFQEAGERTLQFIEKFV
tara:strand:- start:51 stop:746 length:696 start_codon:yes stop_codon:yes gene_type:complete